MALVPVPVRSPSVLRSRRHRDKALLIGLEYRHEGNKVVPFLTGIHDDVRNFRDYLVNHELYDYRNITVLLDDGVGDIRGERSVEADPSLYRLNKPNRKTILREFRRLVEDAREGDRRILLVAGHGTQLINIDHTEADKRDEAFLAAENDGFVPSESPGGEPTVETPEDLSRLPQDHQHYSVLKGLVIDNEFRKELVDAMPVGSQLVAFIETCHSGTLLDLDSKKPENMHAEDARGCGNPARDVANALRLGKMKKFVRKQVRRMTLAALTPVVLVHNSPSFKRILWRSPTRDGAGGRSTALKPFRKTEKRQSTWDPSCTPAAPQMRGNPDLACVISFSSAQDSQSSMSGGPCQSMIQIFMDCLKAEPAYDRSKSSSMILETVRDKMLEQRAKVIGPQWLRPRFGGADRLRKMIQKKQEPQVSTVKLEIWDQDGKPVSCPDTTLDEVLEL